MIKCPYCSAQVNDDSLFCTECGRPIPQGKVCPHCGASVNDGDVFCHSCGKRINDKDSPSTEVLEKTQLKCPYCGASVSEGDTFCHNCGKRGDEPSIEVLETIQMKCPYCSASINDGDVFCENCGRNLSDGSIGFAPNEVVPQTYVVKENTSRKTLPIILCVLVAFLIGGIWYWSSKRKTEIPKQAPQIVDVDLNEGVVDSIDSIDFMSSEQEIQAKKDFIETFYKEIEASRYDETYIRKHITANAKRILNDEYNYDCGGDCLAVWLFSYEAGSDAGDFVSRNITEQDEKNFLVTTKYEYGEYVAKLTVIRVEDSYKIDNIEKVRAEYYYDSTDNLNVTDEDSLSSQ